MGKIQTIQADEGQEYGVAPMAEVLNAGFIRIVTEIVEADVAGKVATVAEKRAAAGALALAHLGVARAAKAGDEVAEKLLALGFALLRHPGLGVLAADRRSNAESGEDRYADGDSTGKWGIVLRQNTATGL